METKSIKLSEVKREWYLVDATNQNLGRLSSKIAQIIRGKNKVNYTPHIDMSDYVIVVNTSKISVTGNKENSKEYWRHTGYPGGGKTTLFKDVMKNNSDKLLYNAVKGMLPHNKLSNQLIKHLKVYAGENHPHSSQNPKNLEI